MDGPCFDILHRDTIDVSTIWVLEAQLDDRRM